jgi:F-type H+-transporting ATPase subunit gamma
MAGNLKDVQRKIKSIKSTRQITKAMELVATSKMKKAVAGAVNLRSYGYLALQVLSKLSTKHRSAHPYFDVRPIKNALVVLFTTDKGLCGGLNSNLFKKLMNVKKGIEGDHEGVKIHYVASGKKGAEFLHRIGKDAEYVFPAYTASPKFSDIFSMSNIAFKGFEAKDFDKVVLVYPDFVSTLVQKTVAKTLLPFSVEGFEAMIEELGSKFTEVAKIPEKDYDYKLEPSSDYILENIVPQLTEMQFYQAVLETTASEHSARMVAMQNATQAADDMLDDLVLTFNQARQAAVTAEIAEISSSVAVIT